jgi:hypothetical protein
MTFKESKNTAQFNASRMRKRIGKGHPSKIKTWSNVAGLNQTKYPLQVCALRAPLERTKEMLLITLLIRLREISFGELPKGETCSMCKEQPLNVLLAATNRQLKGNTLNGLQMRR